MPDTILETLLERLDDMHHHLIRLAQHDLLNQKELDEIFKRSTLFTAQISKRISNVTKTDGEPGL